jgi:hypothetical protein
MSKVKRLIDSYTSHIFVPWRSGIAAPQRVIFCVYSENDELQLRYKIGEFRLATMNAGHEWIVFDVTDSLAEWISEHSYKESYFKNPELLDLENNPDEFIEYLSNKFKDYIEINGANENTVVAVSGVGSLFKTVKVRLLVDSFAPLVKGRLLVLFPGTYNNDTYRLLGASDGWDYLAIPLTADSNI